MERYDKNKMSVYSEEYDNLLKKEIEVWNKYSGSENSNKFEQIKLTAPYETYRKGTIELELEYIERAGKNMSILELGSADGWLTNEIIGLKNVKDITSIDISINEDTKEKYDKKSVVLKGDLNKIEKIIFSNKFDCIITHGTLHHLVNPKKTLEYCIDNLLKENGIIIINDTWVFQSLQLKTNAALYLALNQLPHALLKLNLFEFLNLLFHKIPRIIVNERFAESIAHSHNTSPFESISSADDYRELYDRKDLEMLYFRNFAALPGLQNSWSRSPKIIKSLIQKIDEFLIKRKIFVGDLHLCIIKKIK